MPTKNRGKAARAIVGCAGDGGLGRVLHRDMAKANAPPLKASCLSARAQANLLWGFAATAGMSMTRTKTNIVAPTRAAANRAWMRTAIASAAQRKAKPTR